MPIKERLENYYGRPIHKLTTAQFVAGLERVDNELTKKAENLDVCKSEKTNLNIIYTIYAVVLYLIGLLTGVSL